jgi:hypothetical protein
VSDFPDFGNPSCTPVSDFPDFGILSCTFAGDFLDFERIYGIVSNCITDEIRQKNISANISQIFVIIYNFSKNN